MGASLLRSPGLFLAPRFWAEEAVLYYAVLQHSRDFISMLTLVVKGNYQLTTNLATWLATLVPALWAPHITTLVALAAALVLAWQLARLLAEYDVNAWVILAAAASLALLPQGYEVYFNATNIQWVMGASMFVAALLPLDRYARPGLSAYYGWISLGAFSGIPATLLTPLYIYRYWSTRSRAYLYPAIIVTVGACVQASVVLGSSHEGRLFAFDPAVFTISTLLQTLWSPVASAEAVERVLSAVDAGSHTYLALLVIVTASLPLVTIAVRGAANTAFREHLVTVLAAWLLVSAIQVTGSLDDRAGLVSGWTGGRYFYFGALCFLLIVTAGTRAGVPWLRRCNLGLLLVMLSTSVAEIHLGAWHKAHITRGPDWREEVDACGNQRPCEVDVWPRRWRFSLERP